MKTKTKKEVVAEISKLREIKSKLRNQYSAFGDDHYASIDIQIIVLEKRMDSNEIDVFVNADQNSLAYEAVMWLEGEEVDCSPSESWDGLWE